MAEGSAWACSGEVLATERATVSGGLLPGALGPAASNL